MATASSLANCDHKPQLAAALDEMCLIVDETTLLLDAIQDRLQLHRVDLGSVVTAMLTRCAYGWASTLDSLPNGSASKKRTLRPLSTSEHRARHYVVR